MSANQTELKSSSTSGTVKVTDWTACINSLDDSVVISCTITAEDSSAGITGVGLILNSSRGVTLASCWTGLSSGSESASPSINMPQGNLAVGQSVNAVAQGECEGQHFFFEQEVTITNC